jgi:NADH-quinone oxidoreductase subunit H
MFFLSEYNNILVMAAVASLLFLGGWTLPSCCDEVAVIFDFFAPVIFSIKIVVICVIFVVVRATLPRYRYDQLMQYGWKVALPFLLCFLIFFALGLLVFT